MTDRFILRKNENGKSVRVTFSANGHDGEPLFVKNCPMKITFMGKYIEILCKNLSDHNFSLNHLRLTVNQGVTNLTDRGWLNG